MIIILICFVYLLGNQARFRKFYFIGWRSRLESALIFVHEVAVVVFTIVFY